jgi:hypothetical protein
VRIVHRSTAPGKTHPLEPKDIDMTRSEHYQAAERLIEEVKKSRAAYLVQMKQVVEHGTDEDVDTFMETVESAVTRWGQAIAEANVHAVLATVAVEVSA